ncbi:MAG: TetR family transcriptional regulator [Acidobacteriota bacterium]|nr:TetR family transcriptional regulator [Acidobacteriota bacterium]MDE3106911.1 TetR family transcriptional regulator [Acidobacteriota bacterium]MDE3222568.1 TetR family transcriptional regulator [Acidobacteriota bacterium]
MKREPKSRLDRDFVVGVAMTLVDREGLDALTIRRLAAELSVTPMALYWHFEDKQALLDALSDQLWVEARDRAFGHTAVDEDDEWGQLRHVIRALVDVFREHPTLSNWAPFRVTECEAGLEVTEWTLALLGRVGLNPERAAEVARYLLGSAVMLVGNQPGLAIPNADVREEMTRSKQAKLLTLSPERYPHILAASSYLVACDSPEVYYALGVDLIVGGVRTASANLVR